MGREIPRISQEEWFAKIGHPKPTSEPHGTEEIVRSNLMPLTLTNWRMDGNYLLADTEAGPYAHRVPTDYIMVGIDDNGLPILNKIVL